MAGLTKEQRAQRAAEKFAAELAEPNNSQQEQHLVVMVTDYPAFPGAPITADVHPEEVENWKALGWKETE
ncbi:MULTISPECIES: hypothetical protein [Klebsiella]|uniref:hypothetical protein n=1 Tax=Klebsiella TaxID=570 RepID=UPI0002984C54|nr:MULTISPECIES: hypothetical protein [Klebsiella]EKP24954.1 hypothetical protein KOXM_28420 [Klebsiella michiganensis]HEJ9267218.1 hypothetical protein [Klebsiella oxytoca]ARI08267.1 hypothetical protein BWI76_12275 [Klebsiella sp. M5al]KZT45368.1 hypothetical protein A6A30_20970 [Klebsiella michiganensis]MBZ0042976.1 hypothetical protein [Klebsiella grimontii]